MSSLYPLSLLCFRLNSPGDLLDSLGTSCFFRVEVSYSPTDKTTHAHVHALTLSAPILARVPNRSLVLTYHAGLVDI
jgi:hypothetical protein